MTRLPGQQTDGSCVTHICKVKDCFEMDSHSNLVYYYDFLRFLRMHVQSHTCCVFCVCATYFGWCLSIDVYF